MIPVSGILWKSRGRWSCHSRAVGMCDNPITPRCAEKASHRMKIKKISAMNEIIDPMEEITFHLVYASG